MHEGGTMAHHFWIFAGGIAAAAALRGATKSEGVRSGVVKATAQVMKAGDAVSRAAQSVLDDAADVNAEARCQARIDAAVKERLAALEEGIRAEVTKEVDAAPEE